MIILELLKGEDMKKMIFTIAFSYALSLGAQFSAGIQTGVNINQLNFSEASSLINPLKSSFTSPFIGIDAQYDLNPLWSIRSNVLYVRRGLNIGERSSIDLFNINVPIGVSVDFRSNHIEIPLLLQYNIYDNDISIYTNIGLGISYITKASIDTRATAFLDFNLPEIEVNTNDLNRLSSFGALGIGAALKTNSGRLFGDIHYKHSLESLATTSIIDLNIKNKGFSVGIGYAMSF